MYKKVLRKYETLQKNADKAFGNGLTVLDTISGKAPAKKSGVKINPEHGKLIADAYEQMKHDPTNPDVQAAYKALIDETKQQYNDIMNSGIKISRMKENQENPYKSSKDLHNDIETNKHLHFYATDQGFGSGDGDIPDHPMLQGTGIMHDGQELLANDLFRIVHDINGHHIGGKSGFGPKGEHTAYNTHKTMYSPLAQKALASETLGQNSWVNFGPHGEQNRKDPSKTIYADQKAGLFSDDIINGNWHSDDEISKGISDEFEEQLEKGSLQRRMKFNPETDVSDNEREMVQDWTSPAGTIAEEKDKRQLREDIPNMNPNALQRGLHKIHKDTEVKKHPKTGERMFLLHRGMDDEEHGKLSGNKFLKDYTSSWTPDFKEASSMGYNNTVSAWIPESQIKSIPNAIGQKDRGTGNKMAPADYRSEKEIIVNPHQLMTSKIQGFSSPYDVKQEINQMAKPTKMAASEKTITYEEAKVMLSELVLAKMEGHDTIELDMLEKNVRNAFGKGLTILGMIHGMHYMDAANKPDTPKPKTQQQVQSHQQQIDDAYNKARQEGQEIIDRNMKNSQGEKIDKFLQAISLNESSGGKNTNHKQMNSGIHAGTAALGSYGLMPNTIREMANRMGSDHPMKQYAGMENDQITQSIKKNPDHEHQVAKFMANHLNDKFGGDEDKMSYSWFNGHNLNDDHFSSSHKDYKNHDYVKKYQKHRSQGDQPPINSEKNIASN